MRADKDFFEEEICYLHDACFTGFSYDAEKKEIRLDMILPHLHQRFFIRFLNVQLFEMQSCAFWGPSSNVYFWGLEKGENDNRFANSLFWRLYKEKPASSFQVVEGMIESVLYLTSGDTLTVVCEGIDVEEKEEISQKNRQLT